MFCLWTMRPVPWADCGVRLGLFRGSAAKNTHFQKNDRFWSINNAPKINRRGLFECGPTPHTHGPLFQRKPHVKRHAGCLTALKSLKSPLADWAFLVRAGPRMPGHPPSAPKAAQKAPFHPQTKRGRRAGLGVPRKGVPTAHTGPTTHVRYGDFHRHGPGSASSHNPKARAVPYPLKHPKDRGTIGFGLWGRGRGSTQNTLSPGGLRQHATFDIH